MSPGDWAIVAGVLAAVIAWVTYSAVIFTVGRHAPRYLVTKVHRIAAASTMLVSLVVGLGVYFSLVGVVIRIGGPR